MKQFYSIYTAVDFISFVEFQKPKFLAIKRDVLQVFSEPLKDMGLLTKKTHSILFPHQLIRLMYKHSMFLGRLEERLNNWHHVEKIGDLFCGELCFLLDVVLLIHLLF